MFNYFRANGLRNLLAAFARLHYLIIANFLQFSRRVPEPKASPVHVGCAIRSLEIVP